jgi:phage protein D
MSTTSQLLDGLLTDYYAPTFRVTVGDKTLDLDATGDVLDLRVTLSTKEPGSFSLTINDWDDAQLRFKYSGTDMFDTGRRVAIDLGYSGRLIPVFAGIITSLSPRFPESGSPSLTVGGQDLLRLMALRRRQDGEPKIYRKKADWQIAQEVARRNDLRVVVSKEGPVHERVTQKNQDDAAFLTDCAKRNEFDLYVHVDPSDGQPTLHFEKPRDGRDGRPIRVFTLAWGENLMSFAPRLSTANQVRKVTVRGWDPSTKTPIVATADERDLPPLAEGVEAGPSKADKNAAEVIVDRVVLSKEEAKRVAVSRLMELARRFTTGTGKIIGLPDLRPGDNVDIVNLPPRFAGRYYVTKVEHSLGGSGFTTQFDVERPRPQTTTRKARRR